MNDDEFLDLMEQRALHGRGSNLFTEEEIDRIWKIGRINTGWNGVTRYTMKHLPLDCIQIARNNAVKYITKRLKS